ncbi:MAG: threonine/serine exporter family protein [Lachnospiraceae bacterium]|jgi:uncharacterized membrane protein YjjP (DUF1212 family)|nr:threonine/serine exporter family protein [Lachnospiraceae bacterium]
MEQQEFQAYCAAHYKKVCKIALRAGEIMASHGAEAYRIEDTVCRLLKTTGFSYAEAHVSVTGLFITLSDPSLDREVTLVKRISNRVSDLSQISHANEISRRFVSGELTIEQAFQEFDALENKQYYSPFIILLSFVVISSLFTFMFGGYPLDALASAFVGFFVGIAYLLFGKLKSLGFVRDFLASVVLGIFCILFVYFIPIGSHLQPIISGSIMPLVPGMLLTVAIRDLLHGDYMSGVSRAIEASICAVSIAAGVSIVAHLFERSHGALLLDTPPTWFTWGKNWLITPEMIFQAGCSFFSTITFVILFNIEPKHLVPCGIVGAATWFVYYFVIKYVPGIALSNFFAAVTASAISFYMARRLRAPVTIFFTGGIFCMVPGAGIYQTMYYLIGRDLVTGANRFLNTLEIAALIAIAIAVHTSLDSLLRKHHLKKQSQIKR